MEILCDLWFKIQSDSTLAKKIHLLISAFAYVLFYRHILKETDP